MPIAPSTTTGARGSASGSQYVNNGAAQLTATLTAVPATHSVIVETCAIQSGVTTGNLVSGVTVGGTAATLTQARVQTNNAGFRHELAQWIVPNVTAGDKTVVVLLVNNGTQCNWQASSWPIATSNAVDVTASNLITSPAASMAVPASGMTAAIADPVELVTGIVMSKWCWQWNGTYGEPGPPPTNYTTLAGISNDTTNSVSFQSVYRETSVATGQSISWTKNDGDTTLALLTTFKINSIKRRLRVLAGAGINGKSGITLHAWSGNPKDVLAQEWTGLTAQASGGILYSTGAEPPATWTTGTIVNALAYQPAGSKEGTSYVQAIVEEF